jgi:hypothetical protein
MHAPSATGLIDKQVSANDASQDSAASRASLTEQFQEWNEKSIECIIKKGRVLKLGKKELSKEEWTDWVVKDLHLKAWTAGRYIQISEHPILSDPNYGKSLPADYRSLYELSLIRDHEKLLEYISKNRAWTSRQKKTRCQRHTFRITCRCYKTSCAISGLTRNGNPTFIKPRDQTNCRPRKILKLPYSMSKRNGN